MVHRRERAVDDLAFALALALACPVELAFPFTPTAGGIFTLTLAAADLALTFTAADAARALTLAFAGIPLRPTGLTLTFSPWGVAVLTTARGFTLALSDDGRAITRAIATVRVGAPPGQQPQDQTQTQSDCHAISSTPALALATRESTNSRSDIRLSHRTAASDASPSRCSPTTSRSARRHTVRP